MIGVARPTRGLEFAESSHSIERNLRHIAHITERTWDKPIPDSFNYLVSLLLQHNVKAILFVEEDVVIPDGGFDILMAADSDIAALRYPLKRWPNDWSDKCDKNGNLIWVSMGCTLVKREVFDAMTPPWFKGQYTIESVHEGSSCKEKKLRLIEIEHPYGGHDVYFSWMASREYGFQLASVEEPKAEHLDLVALGAKDSNNGCHIIGKVIPGRMYHGR